MKQVVKVRMLPTQQQAAALRATLAACNEAASWLSAAMHAAHVRRKYDGQRRFYSELKQRFGLSAQPAIRVIGKVADAYATLKSNIEAGNCGPPRSERKYKTHRFVSARMPRSRLMRGACRGRSPRPWVCGRLLCRSGRRLAGAKGCGCWPRRPIWCCCTPARSGKPT
jgi:hypothetical protein